MKRKTTFLLLLFLTAPLTVHSHSLTFTRNFFYDFVKTRLPTSVRGTVTLGCHASFNHHIVQPSGLILPHTFDQSSIFSTSHFYPTLRQWKKEGNLERVRLVKALRRRFDLAYIIIASHPDRWQPEDFVQFNGYPQQVLDAVFATSLPTGKQTLPYFISPLEKIKSHYEIPSQFFTSEMNSYIRVTVMMNSHQSTPKENQILSEQGFLIEQIDTNGRYVVFAKEKDLRLLDKVPFLVIR